MIFNEEKLEQAIIELFKASGYSYRSGKQIHKEVQEVLLCDDLKQFLLNRYSGDDISISEIDSIIRNLKSMPASDLYGSNKTILKHIADGFVLKREDRTQKDLFIRLIDYDCIENNTFTIVNQLEIQGTEKRIPDLILYVNGLPLVVFEIKSAVRENAPIEDAFKQLTIRYRRDIPELFKYNAFCVISDGANSRMGALFSSYDFFYAWRKVSGYESVEVDGIASLHTMINGLFDKNRLLDVIQNFIYFPDKSNHDKKILCRYPQYYAATKLYESIKKNMRPTGSGKGGTYFGATGCGKSYTMLFLTRILMRSKHFQNPTILLITDRTDLDGQLSEQFGNAKTFIGDENVIQVESRIDLKNQLQGRQSGGVFLTTIQKFTENTDLLTDRTNVICISDEAHRSQINLDQKVTFNNYQLKQSYGFAKYLHDSLPNATYVGFTGTPIDATLEVFGDVVDSYTMKESVDDKITVRIIYEGRAAKVLLDHQKVKEIEDYYLQCANDGANEQQIEASKIATTRLDVILGDKDRLKAVASDFIAHYEKRVEEGASVKGKVMFVSSNRTIAHNLYKEIIALRPEWAEVRECDEGVILSEQERKDIKPIEKVKLVMTRGKDDEQELYDAIGAKEERKEFERQFKSEKSNFKIAIVVDMWLTGFDVPFLDAIYIDKPIQQHSLIQTISRVNRVYEGKEMGLVVDYIGIKSNLNIALKQYSAIDDTFEDISKAITVVKDQLDLLNNLFYKFDASDYFRSNHPVKQLNCLKSAAEFVQKTEDAEQRFVDMVKKMRSAYDLCCSNEAISEPERDRIHFYFAVKSLIYKYTKGTAPDIAQMNARVIRMIEEAVLSEGVEEIFQLTEGEQADTSDIFSDEYMAKIEKIKLPNTKIKLLQKLLAKAVNQFKKVNKIKGVEFGERLNFIVNKYNERKEELALQSEVLGDVTDRLVELFKDMKIELSSFKELGVTFEEKAFYDILKSIRDKYKFEYTEKKLIELAKDLKLEVDQKSKYTDWADRDDIKAELQVSVILILAKHCYPPVTQDEVYREIFEQAENFKKYRNE